MKIERKHRADKKFIYAVIRQNGGLMNETTSSPYTGTGYLIVKVATASGAIPIENATVILRGAEDKNESVMLSLITDRDGLTSRIPLPAPSREDSRSPNIKRPFATYHIDVLKSGSYPQYYQNVPVFDGIIAVQNANVIPLSEGGEKNPYIIDEQIFDEYQNPLL